MAGPIGTPTSGNNASTSAGAPVIGTAYTPSAINGGGKGGFRQSQTPMGTPIVSGKSYLNTPVANQPVLAEPVATPIDTSNGGGYADGTMSVQRYARGTTNAEEDDPWNWTKKEQVAPLAAAIKPSEAVIPQRTPDQTEQFLSNQAMGIGTNAAAKGINAAYKAYNAPLTTNAVSTMGTTALGAPVALTNVGAMTTPMSASLAPANGLGFSTGAGGAGLGISTASAAPIGAGIGEGLGIANAATQGAALSSAGATAAGGAAAAGGEAALMAMGPVGMVIGGALLAKKLKII